MTIQNLSQSELDHNYNQEEKLGYYESNKGRQKYEDSKETGFMAIDSIMEFSNWKREQATKF